MPDTRETRSTSDTLLAFFIAAGATAICRFACGPSLGLFFGGVMLVAIVVPPLALLRDSWKSRFFPVVAVVDGIGLVWLFTVVQGHVGFFHWIWCFLILAAFAFAVAALAWSGAAMSVPLVVSSAIAIVASLLWLAWPIWFSHGFAEWGAPSGIIAVHPLLAINSVLREDMGIWTEHALMYRLTNLGQDVPYTLRPPFAAIAAHGLIAGLLAAASYSCSGRTSAGVEKAG